MTSSFGSQHRLSQATSSPAKGKPLEITLQLPPGDPKLGKKGRSSPKGFKTNKASGWLQTTPEHSINSKNDTPEKNQSPAKTNTSLWGQLLHISSSAVIMASPQSPSASGSTHPLRYQSRTNPKAQLQKCTHHPHKRHPWKT